MIYILIFISIIFCVFLFDFNKSTGASNTVYNFYLIVFILIATLRWKVGGDSISYQNSFEEDIPNLFELDLEFIKDYKWEPFFVLVFSFCKTITKDFWFFQFIHAIFINTVFFNFIKKNTSYKYIGLTIYSLFFYFYFNFEILRESIAVAIFVLIYPFYLNKKWKKYYLFVIVAIMFHFSASILLVFPLFRNAEFNSKGVFWLFVMAIFFFVMSLIFPIQLIFALLGDNALNKFDYYSNVIMNFYGTLYKILLFIIIPYIIYRYNNKYSNNDLFKELIYAYFFVSLAYIVISGLGRFLNYFAPFVIIYYANTLQLIFRSKSIYEIKILLLAVIMFFPLNYKMSYYMRSTDYLVKGTYAYNMWFPYSTIFSKEEKLDRETLHDEGLRESLSNTLDNN